MFNFIMTPVIVCKRHSVSKTLLTNKHRDIAVHRPGMPLVVIPKFWLRCSPGMTPRQQRLSAVEQRRHFGKSDPTAAGFGHQLFVDIYRNFLRRFHLTDQISGTAQQ
jgi:hypothetical protein